MSASTVKRTPEQQAARKARNNYVRQACQQLADSGHSASTGQLVDLGKYAAWLARKTD